MNLYSHGASTVFVYEPMGTANLMKMRRKKARRRNEINIFLSVVYMTIVNIGVFFIFDYESKIAS